MIVTVQDLGEKIHILAVPSCVSSVNPRSESNTATRMLAVWIGDREMWDREM